MLPLRHRPTFLALSLVAAATLVACGGGGGSDPATPPTAAVTRLQGTVAVGAPMAGATLEVVDSDPNTADPAVQAAAATCQRAGASDEHLRCMDEVLARHASGDVGLAQADPR